MVEIYSFIKVLIDKILQCFQTLNIIFINPYLKFESIFLFEKVYDIADFG